MNLGEVFLSNLSVVDSVNFSHGQFTEIAW